MNFEIKIEEKNEASNIQKNLTYYHAATVAGFPKAAMGKLLQTAVCMNFDVVKIPTVTQKTGLHPGT
ncbi:MAG TPA: hypothetical protein PKE63_12610 [Lacibacter sp.]|nr:hypothetical protein [Lacibacter sp.]